MPGCRSSLLLIVTKKQGWAKGRGRPKAQSAPTKLDLGKSDAGASTRVAQQTLAVYNETAGIKEVFLVDWSIAQYLPMDRKSHGIGHVLYGCKSHRPSLAQLVNAQF